MIHAIKALWSDYSQLGHQFALRSFLPAGMLFYALLVLGMGKPVWSAERPPNFVIILADDVGYGDLGCYGSQENNTPNIDALAAHGLLFTDYHSAGAMCSPTRAALLTGCYPHRFGSKFDSALGNMDKTKEGLPLKATTIAELLRQKGYVTGCFGKWHLGYQPPFLPPAHGFDEFVGLAAGDGDYHTHRREDGQLDWWHGNGHKSETGYTTELLTKHSVDFIERHQDEPFLLYVPHLAIHFPWQGPNDPPSRVENRDYSQEKWGVLPNPNYVRPHIRAMLTALDESVGEIVAALERCDLSYDTLILFSSDNGGYKHYGKKFHNISNNGPLRDQKGTVFEGGHRVPLIASWPGKIEPGETDALACTIDFFPTLSHLANGSTPPVDGIDLTLLLFQGEDLPARNLYWRTPRQGAIRQGPWKWIRSDGHELLYNLSGDLGERRDLSSEAPDKTHQLAAAWQAWDDDVNKSAEKYQTD